MIVFVVAGSSFSLRSKKANLVHYSKVETLVRKLSSVGVISDSKAKI